MSEADELERLATAVVDCGYLLHRDLGPGLLETAYELLLLSMLRERGLHVERQIMVPLRYQDIAVDNAFKVDLFVEGKLVIELKSVERLVPVHGKQVLTCLRLMDLPLGLLMNIGEAVFKTGVRRIVNDYYGGRYKR
jgi:GxxExxY protein